MKSILPKLAYGLVAILIIAAVLLTLGQRESKPHPSATSYNPSGLHALVELLERNGIEKEISRLEVPRLTKNDLVIAAYVESGNQFLPSTQLEGIERVLLRHVKAGGKVLVLPFDEDFRAKSFAALKSPTKIVGHQGDETLQINAATNAQGNLQSYDGGTFTVNTNFLSIDHDVDTYCPWYKSNVNDEKPFVAFASVGSGVLARTEDGLFATNRFLDQNSNAELALRVIKGLANPKGKVIFAEATLGEGIQPSLASTLGPWASGISAQLTFLFIVVVLTLGVRFGLPELERRKQLGQREIIDAVADVYLRAKSTAIALDVAYEEADRRIRRSLKMPAHVTHAERDRALPQSLVSILSEVERLRKPVVTLDKKGRQRVSYRLDSKEANSLLQRLEMELDAFIPKRKNRLS